MSAGTRRLQQVAGSRRPDSTLMIDNDVYHLGYYDNPKEDVDNSNLDNGVYEDSEGYTRVLH